MKRRRRDNGAENLTCSGQGKRVGNGFLAYEPAMSKDGHGLWPHRFAYNRKESALIQGKKGREWVSCTRTVTAFSHTAFPV